MIIKPGFNDPNFDPRRFTPLPKKVQKGLTHEEQQRLVAAALKLVGYRDEDIPDIERLLNQLQAIMTEVWKKWELEDAMIRAAGKEHNKVKLLTNINSDYLERLVNFDKEELLVMLCSVLTRSTIKEIC